MEYTCFQGIALPPFMRERIAYAAEMEGAAYPSASIQHLLESSAFHQQPELTYPAGANSFYNPQFGNSFPAVSWSTTDPTLLLTPHQQQAEAFRFEGSGGGGSSISSSSFKVPCDGSRTASGMYAGEDIDTGCCGFASFPHSATHQNGSNDIDHDHHHQVSSAAAGMATEVASHNHQIHLDAMARSSGSNTVSCNMSSIDPFSFAEGDGVGVDPVSHAQRIQAACSLLTEEYYSGSDALMPTLVSDYFSPSQKQQPCLYASSTSVDGCGVQDADSCTSSEKDRSTTSEEMNWSHCGNNNSEGDHHQQLHRPHGDAGPLPMCLRGGFNSVTGMLLSPELPDEHSSSVDNLGFTGSSNGNSTTVTNALDVRRPQQQGISDIKSAAASPKDGCTPIQGRASWVPLPISPSGCSALEVRPSDAPALDRMLLLSSSAVSSLQPDGNSGLNRFSAGMPPFPRQQRACYTLDSIPLSARLPPPILASQTGLIPPRLNSTAMAPGMAPTAGGAAPRWSPSYPMASSLMNRNVLDVGPTTVGHYKEFQSLPRGMEELGSGPKLTADPPALETSEKNGPKRDYRSSNPSMMLSPRKPAVTSIEPQSVAARQRRKKISERVRILEKLIPGGNKMDTASMLDEAIEYVKFLQLQVQLLESMGETDPAVADDPASGSTARSATASERRNFPSAGTAASLSESCAAYLHNSFKDELSSAFFQQSLAMSARSPGVPPNNTPLILSEVLQEQLFKQKLCLVSVRQYCPPQQKIQPQLQVCGLGSCFRGTN